MKSIAQKHSGELKTLIEKILGEKRMELERRKVMKINHEWSLHKPRMIIYQEVCDIF